MIKMTRYIDRVELVTELPDGISIPDHEQQLIEHACQAYSHCVKPEVQIRGAEWADKIGQVYNNPQAAEVAQMLRKWDVEPAELRERMDNFLWH